MRGKERQRNHTFPQLASLRGRCSSQRLQHTRNRGTPQSKRSGTAPRRNSNARAYVRLALFILFCALLAVSAGALIFSAVQEFNENSAFMDLAAYVAGDVSALPVAPSGAVSTGTPVSSAETDAPVLEKYRNLHAINPDMVGWIKIEGTPIDYPVMYAPEDGDFYLHHNFEGKTSRSGVPFIDERCNVGQPGANIIIYGHNMKNGSMFGTLDAYKDEAWFQAHPIIQYDTLDELEEYEIVAVFQSQVYKKSDEEFKFYNFLGMGTKSEFDDFYDNIKALSLYDTGVEAHFGDRLVTLSTCDNHVDDGRLVIVARQMK